MRSNPIFRRRRRRRGLPRRAEDWVQGLVACTLIAMALFASGVAMVIGARVHSDLHRRAHVESFRTQVPAVLLVDVQVAHTPGVHGPESLVMAPVRWTGADGVERSGEVRVPGPRQVGDSVPVWIDPGGTLVGRPVTPDEAVSSAVVLAGMFLIPAFGLLVATWCAVRRWALGRCCARWEREWACVEPVWSGRQRWP
ncbi:MAG TPA: hypothetical protein VK735_49715 [Pseudonocardia sp.]|uniref:Rv1733c family protein n=1 Tax=Pseudonocardia sp. TaxID=60912 RepID=UPI002BC7B0F4|nr:hypothetical protein [Pseudonocardia sp.]HTF55577.1 hypothetical protein [Pseudonocardia sp.]